MANQLIPMVNKHFGDLVPSYRKATAAIVREFQEEDLLWQRTMKTTVKALKMGETYVTIVGNQRDADDWDEWEFTIEFPEVVEFRYVSAIPSKVIYEKLYKAMARLTSDPRALKSAITRFMADNKALTELADIPAATAEKELADPKAIKQTLEEEIAFDKLVTMREGDVTFEGDDFEIKRTDAKVEGVGARQTIVLKAVLKLTLDLELEADDIDPQEPEPDYDARRKERLEEPDYARYANNLRHATIRIAADLAQGNETRRKILSALQEDEG